MLSLLHDRHVIAMDDLNIKWYVVSRIVGFLMTLNNLEGLFHYFRLFSLKLGKYCIYSV